MREVKKGRDELLSETGACMICGASPWNPRLDKPRELSELCVHEIAGGPLRGRALDCRFACLVLCAFCNQHEVTDLGKWPVSRQLAVLKRWRPEDYDLVAFNELVNPNAPLAVTEEEVNEWELSL